MTARFLALYDTPADPEAFDRHYREVHIPLGSRLPGLRRYTVGRDAAAVRGAPYYLVAELEWDTMDDLRATFASPTGARWTATPCARAASSTTSDVERFTTTGPGVRASTASTANASV